MREGAGNGRGQRLLLFDIDGTLLSSGAVARVAFREALIEVFGTSGAVDSYRFEGKLDPVIVTELMRDAGFSDERIQRDRDHALSRYLDRLEVALRETTPSTKPGARELVRAMTQEPDTLTALLTGNLERGARLKLTAASLWHHFRFGVWGNEGKARTELGPVALDRAFQITGRRYTGDECVVIGDSRHDVACGLAIGARVVAVATGVTPEKDLAAAGAHAVLRDFSDLNAAREAVMGDR